MTIKIISPDKKPFDFTCNHESFRLTHERDLTIEGGKVIDAQKGIIFQREWDEKTLAQKIYDENKESRTPIKTGDLEHSPKRFYGTAWAFEGFIPAGVEPTIEEKKVEEPTVEE